MSNPLLDINFILCTKMILFIYKSIKEKKRKERKEKDR